MSTNTTTPIAVKSYYAYSPSLPAAAVLCGLFYIGLLITLFQTIRAKAWIWLVMGLAVTMEAVGYTARIISAGDTTARTIYIIQYIMVFLAPVFMAGIIYVVFGRIVFHVVPPHLRSIGLVWVPVRWVTPIFVGFDVLALFLQLIGGVILTASQPTDANYKDRVNLGKNLALAGVTVQIGAFGLFTICAIRFYFTSKRFIGELERQFRAVPGKNLVTMEGSERTFRPNWRAMLNAVNASCLLILIRSVYREVEYGMGRGAYLEANEWPVYVLDALPMLLCVLLYTIYSPAAYVSMGLRQPKDNRFALDSRGPSESDEGYVMNSRDAQQP